MKEKGRGSERRQIVPSDCGKNLTTVRIGRTGIKQDWAEGSQTELPV